MKYAAGLSYALAAAAGSGLLMNTLIIGALIFLGTVAALSFIASAQGESEKRIRDEINLERRLKEAVQPRRPRLVPFL